MFKLTRSLFGVTIAVVAIGSEAQAITTTAHLGQIQQPALNRQAQFHHKASDGSSSFGDPSRQIDRPAGFGAFSIQPRSLYPIDTNTSTQCPAESARDSHCNPSTTANDGKSSNPTPAAANSLKNSSPVARQNSNSNNDRYRVRWSNSNKFKK
jgi:hypothetical protein